MNTNDLKICYGLIDSTAEIKHDGMRKLVTDLNFSFDSIMMPLVDEDPIAMLDYVADDTDYTHLVIFDSGTVLVNSDKLRKALYHLCEKEWLIAGHIMWRPDDQYPYLHHQTYVVNVVKWKELGRPKFGFRVRNQMSLPALWRSPENVHDNYTPLWLKPDNGKLVNVSAVKFGWQMIATSMKNDLPVLNLPNDVRSAKMYIYPDDNPDRLVDLINRIKNGDDVDTSTVENDTQRRFLYNQKWNMTDGSSGVVFIYNTGDAAVNTPTPVPPGALWATASGFKLFQEWIYRGSLPDVQMNTFDYNQRALDIWRSINSEWDGRDLYSFIKSRYDDCDNEDLYCWGNKLDYETPMEASARQEKLLHGFCGSEDEFVSSWTMYKNLSHRYHNINLIEQPESMASSMDMDKHHYVWVNNIFYFNRTIRRYGIGIIQQRVMDFAVAIRDRGVSNHLVGQSASVHFFDPADQLVAKLEEKKDPQYQCQLEFQNQGVRRWAGHPLPY